MPNMISYNYCVCRVIEAAQSSSKSNRLEKDGVGVIITINMIPTHQTVCPGLQILAHWIISREFSFNSIFNSSFNSPVFYVKQFCVTFKIGDIIDFQDM